MRGEEHISVLRYWKSQTSWKKTSSYTLFVSHVWFIETFIQAELGYQSTDTDYFQQFEACSLFMKTARRALMIQVNVVLHHQNSSSCHMVGLLSYLLDHNSNMIHTLFGFSMINVFVVWRGEILSQTTTTVKSEQVFQGQLISLIMELQQYFTWDESITIRWALGDMRIWNQHHDLRFWLRRCVR